MITDDLYILNIHTLPIVITLLFLPSGSGSYPIPIARYYSILLVLE